MAGDAQPGLTPPAAPPPNRPAPPGSRHLARQLRRGRHLLWRLWQVRRAFLLALLPWTAALLLIGGLSYDRLSQSRLEPLRLAQNDLTLHGLTVLSRWSGFLKRDLLFLARSPALARALENQRDQRIDDLAATWLAFSETSGIYDKIRWIDETGRERLRINLEEGHAVRVPSAKLQEKTHRPFFYETMTLHPGQVYYSRLDLNIENDLIELPYKPTLRVATPLFDRQGNSRGVLVLNFLARVLLDRLAQMPSSFGLELNLIDHEGYWLLAPDPTQAWGFMLDHPEQALARRNPKLWQAMQRRTSGQFTDSSGQWTFDTYSPVDGDPALLLETGGMDPPTWWLAVHAPQSVVDDLRQGVLLRSVALSALAFLAIVLFVARITLATHERNQALARLRHRTVELDEANTSLSTALERQRAMQTELVRAEKLSSLGLLVAGVAHELNTPIGAAVVANSTLIKEREALDRQLADGLRRSTLTDFLAHQAEGNRLIGSNLERAAGLIRLFKQLAVDRAAVERRRFALAELVDDTLHMLRTRFKASPHSISAEIPADLQLDSYPGPLGQVLENLVGNALTHAFPYQGSGEIRIGARLLPGGEQIELSVADNGAGIAPEQLERIFDPFMTTRRGQGGTGLGLHLAHHLTTELLGGSLAVSSAPGQGTRFTLTLPRNAPAATA